MTTQAFPRIFAIIMSFVMVLLPAASHAITADDLNSIQYHDAWYDKGYSASNTTCAATGSIALIGSDNEDKIWNYLVGKGLQPFQVAGIMGNMQSESGFNPASQEPGTTSTNPTPGNLGHGIVQWTPGTQLIAPAQAAGTPVNDLGFQLNYFWTEITTGSESNIAPLMKATTNVTEAAQTFESKFERHAGPPQQDRVTQAIAILAKYGSGGGGSSSAGGGGDGSTTTGTACGSTTPGQYQNPLRSIKNLVPERIDAGVDYSGTGSLYALGDGKITYINAPSNSGWGPNNIFISEHMSDGTAAGKDVYMAECITPDPSLSLGETVTSNTVIGQMTICGSGIEVGWATGPGGDIPLGQFNTVNSTAAGVNFSQLLGSLHAPQGILNAPTTGTLPNGWPTW